MPEFKWKLQPSKWLISLIIVLSLASSFNFLFITIPYGISYLGLALTLIYGWMIFKRFGLLSHPKSVLSMMRNKDGQWFLKTTDQLFPVQLLGDSLLTPILFLLRFKSAHTFFAFNILIFHDSLEKTSEYRELARVIRTSDQRVEVFHLH